MHFLRGRYKPTVEKMVFHETGKYGELLLPAGTYRVETHRGKRGGTVANIRDEQVQHALVVPGQINAQIKMKEADIRTHIMDLIHAIREAAAR